MATIDILCVIDTNYLMSNVKGGKLKAGTLQSPTNLGAWGSSDTYIFMICDGQYANNNQGKSELTINANVKDIIRWTITDPSTGLVTNQTAHSYSCILYNFSSQSASGIITPPAVNSAPAVMYYNSLDNKDIPVAGTYMCSNWTSSVLKTGTVQYSWSFQVVDCNTNKVVGYFTWDPFIIIS